MEAFPEKNDRLIVYHSENSDEWKSLDISDAQCWELPTESACSDGFEGIDYAYCQPSLYRLANKSWAFVKATKHVVELFSYTHRAVVHWLTDAQAAELLLFNGYTPPDDVIHHVQHRLVPPARDKAEAGQNAESPVGRHGSEASATGSNRQRTEEPKVNVAPIDNEAMAIALLLKHPDWTDVQIAQAIGVNRTTLYDWPKYKHAKAACRSGRGDFPRGRRNEDGNLEAWVQ